ARIGGDEFVLIMDKLNEAHVLQPILERLLADVTRDFQFEGITIKLNASAGIATFPDHASSADALLVAADLALYRAKDLNGTSYVRYEPHMGAEFIEHRSLMRPIEADSSSLSEIGVRHAI
ncbi:MAG: diguanylate cyclase, partial [Pseudomonadota bacterium]